MHGTTKAALWTMKAAALGLAALAIGIQTLRWIIAKTDIESEDDGFDPAPHSPAKEKGTSNAEGICPTPFGAASVPSINLADPPRSHDQTAPPSSQQVSQMAETPRSQHTEPATSPQARGPSRPPKTLRFLEVDASSSVTEDEDTPQSSTGSDSDGEQSSTHAFGEEGGEGVDASVQVHTPDSTRLGSILGGPKQQEDTGKSPYDTSNGWAAHSYREARSALNGQEGDGSSSPGRHLRRPSFPVIDYEPEHSGFGSPNQGDMFDMHPAPTEEGDAIPKVEEVMADLEEQAMLGVRRHSRSFSEPNLAAKLVHQQAMQARALLTARHESSEDDNDDSYPMFWADEPRAAAHGGAESTAFGTLGGGDASTSGSRRNSQSAKRSRDEMEQPPLLRLEVLSGPASGRDITVDDPQLQVTVGRLGNNMICIEDSEVSSMHCLLTWDSGKRAWQVMDLGSLNGTRLNGNFISNTIRRPGKNCRLRTDDILLLGSRTAIKVILLPNAGLPEPPQNLKKLFAPPSGLQPTLTLKSDAMASLRAELATDKAFREEGLRLGGAVVCRVGAEHQRKGGACEDVPFCGETGRYQAALYCVFDGHCGRKTASTCTKALPEELRKRMAEMKPRLDSGEGGGRIWEEVFLATDAALETEDGTTATAVLVWKDSAGNVCLQTANVGDSAAVFCESRADPGSGFTKLTVDHRISEPGEKRRLADLGIELGKNRTRLYGLNVSRCLGDHFIKSADLGFTAVPHVSPVLRLAPGDSGLMVIASDGLWDVAEPGQVMQVAFEAQSLPESSPESIADAVYQHAMKQRSRDDVCVIVLSIAPELVA